MNKMFTPNLKRKRGARIKCETIPFPIIKTNKYEGVFTGLTVEVFKTADIIGLYEHGCFGKGNQSRGAPRVVRQTVKQNEPPEETLTLNLEEAFFLSSFLNVLTIKDLSDVSLTWQLLLKAALEVDKQFIEKMAAYIYLRSKAWIVKSGIKYGGNFLIYKKDPRLYHASFVVVVNRTHNTKHLITKDLKGLQRIAEAADKDVLLLDVSLPSNFQLNALHDFKEIFITETIVRRFNQTVFVAQQNKSKQQKVNKQPVK